MLLVTGGAGYIGSHFVQRYLEANPTEAVVVVDNLTNGYQQATTYTDRIHFVQADIAEQDTLRRVMRDHGITAVAHFAASIEVGESQQNPQKFFENNVIGSLQLFEAMEAEGVRHILFSSTCATYGNPQYMPLDESHPQNPVNVYGLTKLMIEQALKGYQMSKGWSWVALRYFNAAGATPNGLLGESHHPETHLIPLVLQTALGQRKTITVFGTDYDTADGTCIRDFIHVDDLADAHILALADLRTKTGSGEAFNLGSEKGYSVLEVIQACERVTGKTIPVTYGERRNGDAPVLIANSAKLKSRLGWQPQHTLESMVETAWQWAQNPRYSHQPEAVLV